MSSSFDTANQPDTARQVAVSDAVLANEAGVPFKPAADNDAEIDPIAQWLSLMEVIQMLCPAWPVRVKPMQGNHWLL